MTGLLEASVTEATPRDAAPRGRPSAWARWRVAARLARRQVWRAKGASALVMTLVALPIAAMSAYAVYAMSSVGTAEERSTVELGGMQAWVRPAGVPDAGFWQAPNRPDWNGYPVTDGGGWQIPPGGPVASPVPWLPRGAETIELTHGDVAVKTLGGTARLEAWGGPAWDPRFAGRFDLTGGVRAAGADEAMVTAAALDRLGIAIGGELALAGPDAGRAFTVVGTLDAATIPDAVAAVFLPGPDLVPGEPRWYLPDTAISWQDVQQLNAKGIVAYSRQIDLDPPTVTAIEGASAQDAWLSSMWTILTVLAVAGAFVAYVAVMLAGAAFAVSARRQQRSLAMVASVGARPRDLARTIALQGTVLGIVGGVIGIVAGIGVAALVMQLTQDGSATRYWGFHVPWPMLAIVFAFAAVVGTASALMPARTVTRSDVIGALRGARRPQRLRASRPIWGSVLLLAGIGVTAAAAAAATALSSSTVPYDSPLRTLPPVGIVVGPVLVQIGVLVSGAWLLWWAARGLSRVGLSARLAARDAAANASRTVPAFAAIAATVFLGVFAIGQSAMQSASSARTWFYAAPLGALSIEVTPSGMDAVTPDAARTAIARAADLARSAGADHIAVVSAQPDPWFLAQRADDAESEFVMALLPSRHLLDPNVVESFSTNGQHPTNPISVIMPGELEVALGMKLSAGQLAAYRAGAALAADPRYVTDGRIELAAWTARDASEGRAPDNIWDTSRALPGESAPPDFAEPLWTDRLDAITVDRPNQPISIAIAPSTAARLGIVAQPESVVAGFAQPPPVSDLDRVAEQSALVQGEGWALAPRFETGPPSSAVWMVPSLAGVAVHVLGARAGPHRSARYERRPDDATLTAIGGTRRLRRRIGFWQGLVIAGFGTLSGTVAGILPPLGFALQSQLDLRAEDIPWTVLAMLAVGLPLAIATVSWLVPPRDPDLTRRTVIA
jgi:hypothetical protein